VFKRIFLLGRKNPQKALNALMVYTNYIHRKVSTTQLNKFRSALGSAYSGSVSESEAFGLGDRYSFYLIKDVRPWKEEIEGWSNAMRWASRKIRIPDLVADTKSVSFDDLVAGNVPWKLGTKANNPEDTFMYADHPLVINYISDLDGQVSRDLNDLVSCRWDSPTDWEGFESYAGRIGFIQEPGLKLRSVANPWPILQLASSRLGNFCYQSLRKIEEDSTFDQDKSVRDVQEWIRKGGSPLMSIDLSSATDRFPLSFTLGVLEGMGVPKAELNLFEGVARASWATPQGETVRWEVGQPLGLYPSFGAFALSHHALARSTRPQFYRILGDDIVIDQEAGVRLRELYCRLGVPISEDKSLLSHGLAEFGGRLITSDRVFVQPKWRDISPRSFLDLIRNLGPQAIGLMPHKLRRIVKECDPLLPEVVPFGLNWNTGGLPYHIREAMSLVLQESTNLQRYERQSGSGRVTPITSVITEALGGFTSPVKPQSFEVQTQFRSDDPETAILDHVGVTNCDFPTGEQPPGWYPDTESVSGDPRGPTTAEVVGRKVFDESYQEEKKVILSDLDEPPCQIEEDPISESDWDDLVKEAENSTIHLRERMN
jgi:hypothetical protein